MFEISISVSIRFCHFIGHTLSEKKNCKARLSYLLSVFRVELRRVLNGEVCSTEGVLN